MIAVTAALVLLPQDPDLAAVRASEQRRVEVVARCAAAVCSVGDMSSPGGGSGVIFDPAGFVLTNYHVVGDPVRPKGDKPAEEVRPTPPEPPHAELEAWQQAHPDAPADERAQFVAAWQGRWRDEHWPTGKYHWHNKKVGLPDGEVYEAVVLGIDPGSDLAVLRLLPKAPGQTWPACAFGDSDQLLVGETVFAMGNPFLLATDFTPTVTFGIVSGTHRYQEGGGNRMLVYPDCIQVDAPVNPGNSGGPLFSEAGEIIGINGRISIGDRGRVNVGVGFAIASNQIVNFLGDLLAGRHAEHGTLDMSCWYMTAPREQTQRRGVFVQQMYKDSVAAAAGLSLGDEITSFNGVHVRSANQLATLIGVLPAHAWVTLGFRPTIGDGYGDERVVPIRLSPLDTGSSADAKADAERLASRENRRLATAALCRQWPAQDQGTGVTFTLVSGTERQQFRRQGERLRVDRGDLSLVRTGRGAGFAIENGKVRDSTAEEAAFLERQFAGNTLLWTSGQRSQQLDGSLLVGGAHVLGAPAWRFALAGDGEIEALVFRDGSPAGCVLRDPLRRQRVELHARSGVAQLIADGAIDKACKLEGPTAGAIADDVFGRPQ
jgi:S1-C subfamily serine protease